MNEKQKYPEPKFVTVRLLRDYWPIDRSVFLAGEDRLCVGVERAMLADEAGAMVAAGAAEVV